jgi:PAS domain S-box-containing protein
VENYNKDVKQLLEEIKILKGQLLHLKTGASKNSVSTSSQAKLKCKEIEDAKKLELALEAGEIGLWEWEINNSVIQWSESVYKIFGVNESITEITLEYFYCLIHPNDLSKFNDVIQKTLKDKISFTVETRILKNGEVKWLQFKGIVVEDEEGMPFKILGNVIDITERVNYQRHLNESENRLRAQNEVLLSLSAKINKLDSESNGLINEILKASAETLEVERASIWLLEDNNTQIKRLSGFYNSTFVSKLKVIHRKDCPAYFLALENRLPINVFNVFSDPRTIELADYCVDSGITSLLDIPLLVNGEIKGVVSFEHAGPFRTWALDEQNFAGAVVNLISLYIAVVERKKAENKLLLSQNSYFELFNKSSDLFYILDENNIFLDVNESVIKKYGFQKHEIIGKKPEIFNAEALNDLAELGEKLELARNGQAQKLDWWSKKKNGEIFPKEVVLRKGSYFGKDVIIAEGRDITERIKSEKLIIDKEQTLSTVLNNINYLTYSSELINGELKLNYISPQVEKILGFTKEEFTKEVESSSLINFYHPEDVPKINAVLKEILSTKKGLTLHYRFKHKLNKNYIWLEESVFPRYDENGERIGNFGILKDISDRVLSENSIKESEQRFKLLSEVAIEGIVLSKNFKIIDCNNRYFQMHGFSSKEEIIGMDLLNFIHKDYHETVKWSIYQDISQPIEVVALSKDNKKIIFESRGMNIPYHGEQVRVSVIYDITQRKLAEDNLKESERALSTLMGNLPGMAYRCKVNPLWDMEFVSQGCYLLTEYKPEDFVGNKKLSYSDIIDQKDREKISKIIKSAIKQSASFEVEYKITTASGKVKWMWERGEGLFDETGNCIVLEGFIADISERKEYESLIRQSRKSFKDLVEHSPVGVIILQADKVAFANPSAKEIFGSKGLKIEKTSIFNYILPEFHQLVNDNFHKIQKEENLPFFEIRILSADGIVKDLEVIATSTKFIGVPAVQVVCHDVSYKKQLQKEQLRAEIAEETTKRLQEEIDERIKAENRLIENQKFTRSIIDSSLDIIIATDKDSKIIEFNEAAEEAFGYTFSEVKGNATKILFSSEKEFRIVNNNLKRTGKFSGEINNIRKNGELFTSYISASILLNKEGEIIGSMGVSRDITEIKLEDERKETQYAVSRILSEAVNFQEAAPAILSAFSFGFGFDYGEVWLWNPDKPRLEFSSFFVHPASRGNALSRFQKFSSKSICFPEEGIIGKIWSSGKQLWFNSIEDAGISEWNEFAKKSGFKSSIGFPIKNGRQVIGVVNFLHSKNIISNYNHQNLFSALGSQIGQFIVKKKAEEELRASEEKFKAIYDVAPVGIAKISKTGDFIQVNQRLCQIFSCANNVFYSKNIIELICPQDKAKAEKSIKNLISNKVESFTSEFCFYNSSGKEISINLSMSVVKDENGKTDFLVCVFEDVTEKKKSDEKVLGQAAKLNSIFESSSHQIWTLDRSFKVTSFNKNYVNGIKYFFGAEPKIGDKAIVGNSLDILSENSFSNLKKYFSEAFDGIPQYFELPVVKKDGKNMWLEVFLNPIRLEKGKIEEISCIAQDVTSKKEAELQIKKSLKEKEVLLKEVHHRVKNNLQVISSILNLQSSSVKNKKILNILRESQDRIKSMAYIHESLYQTKDFSNINFSEYLENLSKNLVHSYRMHNNLIELELDIDKVYLNLDLAIPCGLIVNELVSNSLKYAFPKKREGKVNIEVKIEGSQLTIMVKDNGVGFPKDLDFRKTESLGLQLVTTLTEQIRGKVVMESKENEGTSFKIIFKPIKTK